MRHRKHWKPEIITLFSLSALCILYALTKDSQILPFLGMVIGGYFGNLQANTEGENRYYDPKIQDY